MCHVLSCVLHTELKERMRVTEAELQDKGKELETLREQLSQTPKETQVQRSNILVIVQCTQNAFYLILISNNFSDY